LLVVSCQVRTGLIQVIFLNWDLHFFRHIHLTLHVSTSLLLFIWLPCFVLYLPSRCTFSLLSTLCRKMKQTGSSENVGFNYWSKGLFPFLFDLYSLPYSSLNNISLPVGNGTLVDVPSWEGRRFSSPLPHIISLEWMIEWRICWLKACCRFCGCLINWMALQFVCSLVG